LTRKARRKTRCQSNVPWKLITYDLLKNVDLVEEHALLVVVHVALAQHLHCALRSRLPVHAHAHFTESTYLSSSSQEMKRGSSLKERRSLLWVRALFFFGREGKNDGQGITYQCQAPFQCGRSREDGPGHVQRTAKLRCLLQWWLRFLLVFLSQRERG
jgi:hypothetical protein